MSTPRFTMVVLLIEDLRDRSRSTDASASSSRTTSTSGRTSSWTSAAGHNLVLTTTFVRNDPDRRAPSGGARTFLEFFVDGDEAVNAKYDELVAAGYRSRRPPFRTDFDAWMALVDDPDGNTVLVTAG